MPDDEASNVLPPGHYQFPMPQELIDTINGVTEASRQLREHDGVRLIIEVVAGLIPLHPEPEFTKKFVITSSQWQEAEDQMRLLTQTVTDAMAYATLKMMRPDRLNWVRVDWLWP